MSVINAILNIRLVQYALVIAVVILGILLVISRGELKVAKSSLDKANAAVALQNEAIAQAGEEYKTQEKKALAAQQQAQDLAEQLKKRKTEIRNIVLQGPCDEMVLQVVREVRK
jgi:Tfp pilus assembly protein PilE